MTAKILPFRKDQEIGGRYTLLEPLGEGGIGVVWKGWQRGVERPVAIKFLKDRGSIMQQRFEVEAQALGMLNHPNCVTVYDFGYSEDQRAYYLVTEYLEGEDLSARRGTRMTFAEVLEIGKQISAALAYAHHHGIAHRDLKPENVFLVEDYQGKTTVKVIDFGLAKMVSRGTADITGTGEVFGTPAYMSPEQIRGTRDAGTSSDLYSLGIMLYEMIDDRLPFWGDDMFEVVSGHVAKPVPPLNRPNLPTGLEGLVRRLLEKEPAARFRSALELYDALDAIEITTEERLTTTDRFVHVESPHETLASLPPAMLPTEVSDPTPMYGMAQANVLAVDTAVDPQNDVPQRSPTVTDTSSGRRLWVGLVILALFTVIAAGLAATLVQQSDDEQSVDQQSSTVTTKVGDRPEPPADESIGEMPAVAIERPPADKDADAQRESTDRPVPADEEMDAGVEKIVKQEPAQKPRTKKRSRPRRSATKKTRRAPTPEPDEPSDNAFGLPAEQR